MKKAEDLKKEVKIKLDLKLKENELKDYSQSDEYKQEQLKSDIYKITNLIEFEIYKIISEHAKIDSNIDTNLDIKSQFFKSSLVDIKNELINLGYRVKLINLGYRVNEIYCDSTIYGNFPYNSYKYLSIDLKMFLQL